MWLKEGFKDLLKSWWEGFSFHGSSSFILAAKLRALKFNMKTWNGEVFGQLEVRKARAIEQATFWDTKERSCILSLEEVETREGVGEYKKWVLLEEISWR